MKKNLLLGILGGAAVGAAAYYLLGADERRAIGNTLRNKYTGLLGELEEAEESAVFQSPSRTAATAAKRKGNTTTGRRG